MKVIITLSGNSERFTTKGYTIKPLININGRLILDYVLDMFPKDKIKDDDFIFLTKNEDISKYAIEKEILLRKKSKIVSIDKNNLGPVFSISKIFDQIPNDEEIIISYCDLTQKWDVKDFLNFCRNSNSDGCIVTHVGFHPHKLYNKSFAFLKVNGNIVEKIQEKKSFTDASYNEPASNGIYYFKSGTLLKKYFIKLIENKIAVNGEYYVTLPYNLMIDDKLIVTHYITDNFICLGTPSDVICFDSWINILKHNNINSNNVLNLYKYWNDYVS
jgi:NDP-sugar pyrophosphorylase family protein